MNGTYGATTTNSFVKNDAQDNIDQEIELRYNFFRFYLDYFF